MKCVLNYVIKRWNGTFLFLDLKKKISLLILVVWRRKAFAEQTFFISFVQGFSKTLYIKLAIPHVFHSLGTMSSVQPLVHQVKALRPPIIHSHISFIYSGQWNWGEIVGIK